MSDSEFFKIVPMELQEKAKGRANLVESLSRRSSIMPGQSLLPMELTLGLVGASDEIAEERDSEVESGNEDDKNPKLISFPYKEMTNENLRNIRNRLGIIDLSFSSGINGDQFVNRYPVKYYTWTQKEQLLLVFAENFRRKFNDSYKLRQPLLLAPKNECGIQVIKIINLKKGKKDKILIRNGKVRSKFFYQLKFL